MDQKPVHGRSRCNGSSAIELETHDFRSVPDQSWLTYFQLSRICLMYPCLPPSSHFFAPQSCHQPPFRFWDNLPTRQPHVLCIYALWLIPSLSSNNHHSFSHLFDIACTTTLGRFNLVPVILVLMEGIWLHSLSRAQVRPHSCLLLTIPDQLLYTFSALLIGPLALWLGPAFLWWTA